MSTQQFAARNLLLLSLTLILVHHISAKAIEPESGAISSLEEVFDIHSGRSRVARSASASSLLRHWKDAEQAYSEMNDKLTTYDVRTADAGGIRCNLAISYGKLTSANVQQMDDHLKVMIAGTLRSFNRNPQSTRTWDSIMSTMLNNPLLEEETAARVHREDGYTINEVNNFRTDGGADPVKVAEFSRWLTSFLNDEDVRRDTKINLNSLAQIVSETGARIDSARTFFHRRDVHEKSVIDIGILRFPDIDNPFMKVYRIQLKVRRNSNRILFRSTDNSEVEGIFDSAKFKPRMSVMARLREAVIEQACSEVEDIFS